MEESPVTHVCTSKRVKEINQPSSEPVEKSVCKSTINKPKKKLQLVEIKLKPLQSYPQKTKQEIRPVS